MKAIYLVKKNPDISDENNWIYMNIKRFADFLNTPEGLRRAHLFKRLGRCSEKDYEIIIECSEELAPDIERDYNRAKYLAKMKRKAKPIILSLSAPISEDDPNRTYADMIASDEDVEKEAVDNVLIEKLSVCLKLLSKEDKDLIDNLYLRTSPLTVNEYHELSGLAPSTIYKHRNRILKDLRILLKYADPAKEA